MSPAAIHHLANYTPRNPQVEDGFTRIANELIDAMSSADLTENEQRVLYRVIRKTYGYNKKQDDIAASQIGIDCRMASSHVTATLNSLARKHFIHKRPGTHGCIIGVQKDWSLWPMRPIPAEFADGPKKRRGRPSRDEVFTDAPVQDIAKITPTESVGIYLVEAEKPLPIPIKPLPIPPKTPTESVDTKDKGQKKRQKTKPLSPKATKRNAGYSAEFLKFYEVYPRHDAKKPASAAFANALETTDLATIMAGAERAVIKYRGKEEQFIPLPSTWLNEERWTDEVKSAYSETEKEVIRQFNDLLGTCCGDVDENFYVEENAVAIRAFLTFDARPELARRYFQFIVDTSTVPPMAGFSFVLSREGFNKFKGGQFAKRGGK